MKADTPEDLRDWFSTEYLGKVPESKDTYLKFFGINHLHLKPAKKNRKKGCKDDRSNHLVLVMFHQDNDGKYRCVVVGKIAHGDWSLKILKTLNTIENYFPFMLDRHVVEENSGEKLHHDQLWNLWKKNGNVTLTLYTGRVITTSVMANGGCLFDLMEEDYKNYYSEL